MSDSESAFHAGESGSNSSQLQPGWEGSTDWSMILLAAHEGAPGSKEALEELCRRYRQPVYGYIWTRCRDRERTEDLSQGFFEHFLKQNGFGRLEQSKGRFRSYLLVCIKNFLVNEWDKEHAIKRGNGRPVLSLEEKQQEEHFFAAAPELSPEELYDRRWALAVLERTLRALEKEEVEAGRGARFARFSVFLTAEGENEHYEKAAADLNMTKEAVAMAVMRLKKRFQDLLLKEIRATLVDPRQANEEIRALKAALSAR